MEKRHPIGWHTKLPRVGFSVFEDAGTWTDGPSAEFSLSVPLAKHDLVLEMEGGAFLHSEKLPDQSVKIYANETFIGRWCFTIFENAAKRNAVIPRGAVGTGGNLTLRFQIERPVDQSKMGIGEPSRNLGIYISTLRINERSLSDESQRELDELRNTIVQTQAANSVRQAEMLRLKRKLESLTLSSLRSVGTIRQALLDFHMSRLLRLCFFISRSLRRKRDQTVSSIDKTLDRLERHATGAEAATNVKD